MELLLQPGLILSWCFKIINLITSLPLALWEEKKKSHQWDFENTFTEAQAASVSANIGFCCGRSKWVRVTLGTGKTMAKWDQGRENQINKKSNKSDINGEDKESTLMVIAHRLTHSLKWASKNLLNCVGCSFTAVTVSKFGQLLQTTEQICVVQY